MPPTCYIAARRSNNFWLYAEMELQSLRYFVALADELNFTRAAQRCFISQQAFSKAIAGLERRLGTTMVVRRSRGCSLTPAGARLAVAARALLAHAVEVEAAVARVGSADRSFRIGMLLDGLGSITPALLAGFRTLLPDLRIETRRVQPSELPAVLLTGVVDVALLHGPVHDERIVVVPLFGEPRVIALSRADPRSDAARLTSSDVLDLPARTRRPGIDQAWEGFFTLVPERNGEQPQRTGEPTRSLEDLLWSIAIEQLFLTVPEHLAGTYPSASFGVAYVPVPDLPAVSFGVAHRRDDERPEVRTFVEIATAVTPP